MQHRQLKYEDAVDLIEHINAVEIHAYADTQVFKGTRPESGIPTFIIVTGTDALLIEARPELQAAHTS
ncbi:hypothetical protein HA520_20840 [Azotobacter chroococcum]|uniref:Uncharacterized protein n=1 Tax=Azotobacter chroococcum TaxID=353 RepID=A0AA43ZBJ0_9GAMM|nr:hypothetical protein [Azotobacter chroococcum]NHN79689.1 hypothetical protein [Azotobacter chroococcum]